jgi:hypothetical protein
MMFGLGDAETKIRAFIRDKFDGDPANAFAHYATDGKVGEDALDRFLKDAGVGGAVYRGMLVSLALRKLDADGDDRISLKEFKDGFPTEEQA